MGFIGAIKIGYRKIFKFSSRSSRSEYWYFSTFTMLLYAVGFFIEMEIQPDGLLEKLKAGGLSTSYFIVNALTMVPWAALAIRRLHDVNKSGWWYWIIFTGIGAIPLIYWLGFKKSDENENDYGSNPLKVDPNEQNLNDLKSSITLKILFVLVLVNTVVTLFSTIYLSTTPGHYSQNKVTSIGQLVINDAKKLADAKKLDNSPSLIHSPISEFTKIHPVIFVDLKSINKKNNNSRTAWFLINNGKNGSLLNLKEFSCNDYEEADIHMLQYDELNAQGNLKEPKEELNRFRSIKKLSLEMHQYSVVCGSNLSLEETPLQIFNIPDSFLAFDRTTIHKIKNKPRAWYFLSLPTKYDKNNNISAFMSFTIFSEFDCQAVERFKNNIDVENDIQLAKKILINIHTGKNLNKYLDTACSKEDIKKIEDLLYKKISSGAGLIDAILTPAICKATKF